MQLYWYLYQVASRLKDAGAFSEAMPYARRAFKAAPAGLLLCEAGLVYAEVLYDLANFTEAEKVREFVRGPYN
jgi:hypothetical protein